MNTYVIYILWIPTVTISTSTPWLEGKKKKKKSVVTIWNWIQEKTSIYTSDDQIVFCETATYTRACNIEPVLKEVFNNDFNQSFEILHYIS